MFNNTMREIMNTWGRGSHPQARGRSISYYPTRGGNVAAMYQNANNKNTMMSNTAMMIAA